VPTHIRMRCSWQFKNDDAKNQAVINPCFRHQLDLGSLTGPDWQTLTDDLGAALSTWNSVVPKSQLTVTAYDIEGAKPNYPKATTVLNAGSYMANAALPQAALCLSFYAGNNVPRRRGRIYVPVMFFASATALGNFNAAAAERNKVMTLGPIFANLGGTNVDWIVWSTVENAAHKVTNYWCDDSWDIIRTRKLASVARTEATTSG
jgi:hypothetical protein